MSFQERRRRKEKKALKRLKFRSQFGETLELRELIEEYDIHRLAVDIGARLKGSNTYDLCKTFGFRGVFVEKNSTHLCELKRHFPEGTFYEFASLDNINDIVPKNTGVLSIDVDGNDYHLWQALDKYPQIVIIETGPPHKIKDFPKPWIPEYDPTSMKRKSGACKEAMLALGESKGYRHHKTFNVNMIFLHESLYPSA